MRSSLKFCLMSLIDCSMLANNPSGHIPFAEN
jgi:hypothetical protein